MQSASNKRHSFMLCKHQRARPLANHVQQAWRHCQIADIDNFDQSERLIADDCCGLVELACAASDSEAKRRHAIDATRISTSIHCRPTPPSYLIHAEIHMAGHGVGLPPFDRRPGRSGHDIIKTDRSTPYGASTQKRPRDGPTSSPSSRKFLFSSPTRV